MGIVVYCSCIIVLLVIRYSYGVSFVVIFVLMLTWFVLRL